MLTPHLVTPELTPHLVTPELTPHLVTPELTPHLVTPEMRVALSGAHVGRTEKVGSRLRGKDEAGGKDGAIRIPRV